ncbi:MAG TPA: MFS transporter [Euzebyales bacterium]|nr:MFS transporter [Euzebyales bacterium]
MRTSTGDLRPLLLVEAATLMSGMGNGIALVTLPWIVLELTGEATSAGIVATATALPLVVSSVFSGTVVDLLGRRATAMASDMASALTVAAIPVLDMTVGLSVPAVAALAALGAVFDPAGVTARESMLPDAALHAGLRLQRANGIHEAVWGIAFLVGPGVGGLLIALVGASTTMWATAAGFAGAVLLIAAARVPASGRPRRHDRPAGLLQGTFDGLRFFWSDRLLRVLGLVSMVIVALYLPIEGVLLPTWFQEQGAPQHLGAVVMGLSVGGIIGALGYGQWGGRVGRRTVYLTALVGTAIALVAMATLPPTPLLITAAVAIGVLYGPIQPLVNLAAQTRTPPRLRGRVIGVLVAAEYAAGPVGYLTAGPAVDAFGIRPTFMGLAVALLVVALGTLLLPSLRLLAGLPDAPPDTADDLPAPDTLRP